MRNKAFYAKFKENAKFLVVYVSEIEDKPGKYNVYFHDDCDIDPYRAEALPEKEAIAFAEKLLEEQGHVGGEIIIETNDGKARLLWDSDRR
ncbi:MAG: hypothetical protein IJ207_00445 [Treponema sp.]|uniref:hypothetical protein n=1 Tax=Treponema sp. TaxID=166 RepID=UPI0025DF05EF|nr:hypothetical protein [Treponema sp.]MBQ9280654.1 hypothetical protein [Treponema sp.]